MADMFQEMTKFDSIFVVFTFCFIGFLWILGIWKLIEIIF